jgi:hypothetical protein
LDHGQTGQGHVTAIACQREVGDPEQLPTSYRLAVEGDPAEWVDRVGPVPPAVIAVAEPVPWWQGSFAPAGGDD